MAVANIDTVYQRVLALANKEQRGYITPQEFNLLAGKAQNDIFEMYFHDYKTALLSPGNQSKSADDIDMLREKIAMHRVVGGNIVDGVLSSDPHWLESVYTPINAGVRSITLTIDTLWSEPHNSNSIKLLAIFSGTGNESLGEGFYDIYLNHNGSDVGGEYLTPSASLHIDVSGSTHDVANKITKAINDNDPYHTATVSGNVITITYNRTGYTWSLNESLAQNTGSDPSTLMTLGTVVTTTVVGVPFIYEQVNKDDWIYIQSNKKLSPTTNSRGVFYRTGATGISILPDPGDNTVSFDHIKRPVDPKWGYVVVGDKALYNSNTSTGFELHASEESTLTNKILELAGIVINKPGLSDVILRNEAVKEANENK